MISSVKLTRFNMLTIKDYFTTTENLDEMALVEISEKIWKLGTLDVIKTKVSPELFTAHVAMNTIGNWMGDGWWLLVCQQAELVPYIADALDELELHELANAFRELIALFPEFTVFDVNEDLYIDIINFLQNVRTTVEDERLNAIPADTRKKMVEDVKNAVFKLEDLTDDHFKYDEVGGGFIKVIDYIKANYKN